MDIRERLAGKLSYRDERVHKRAVKEAARAAGE
jgi:hypothetical protein